MWCNKHPADVSSSVGVCATCLRQSLHVVIAAQIQANQGSRISDSQQLPPPPPPPPPPLPLPRSVSPYISRRRSDTAATLEQNHRFFSTPQAGPTASITAEIDGNRKSGGGGRFSSFFSALFRSKSAKPNSDSGPIVSADSCSASPSWFSNIIPGLRKKNVTTNSTGAPGETRRNRDRGVSPARCCEEDEERCAGIGSSGYSTEQTPQRTAVNARRGGGKAAAGQCKNVSGLVLCMSPLIRPSPSRHRNQKGVPPEIVAAGESRVPPKPNLSNAPSLCKNRSRKLVDLGKHNYNPNH